MKPNKILMDQPKFNDLYGHLQVSKYLNIVEDFLWQGGKVVVVQSPFLRGGDVEKGEEGSDATTC